MAALDFNVVDHPPLEPIESIKARTNIIDVVGRYADLKKRKADYWACCPLHSDGTPSFKVNPARQSFYCFGCGAKGDVFDFVMAAENVGLPAAVERILDIVGGSAPDPAAALAAQAARRAAAARQEAQEAAQRTALARRIWSEAEHLTRRSDPLAVAYLTERRGLPAWCSYHLRWHAACPWETGTAGCIVVACRDAQDELRAIWRIRPAMEGKVERKGLGPVGGCLATVMDDAGLDEIAIAEGVEDALAAQWLVNVPTWAALSAGNMERAVVPERFRSVLIVADSDAVGTQAGLTLARRLRAEGRHARVIVPTAGKDANDVLRGRAA
jgi:DNA primase